MECAHTFACICVAVSIQLCVIVCMCMWSLCECVRVGGCDCICIYVCVYICTLVCVPLCLYAHVCNCVSACVSVNVPVGICVCMCVAGCVRVYLVCDGVNVWCVCVCPWQSPSRVAWRFQCRQPAGYNQLHPVPCVALCGLGQSLDLSVPQSTRL